MYKCACVHLSKQADSRGQRHESSIALKLILLRQGLSVNLEVTVSAILAGQGVPRICLSLPSSARVSESVILALT